MRYVVLILFSMAYLLSSAQQGEDVFTVRNPYNVWLQPPVQQMFAGQSYHFKIKGIALKEVASATMNRTHILITDTDIVITPQPVTGAPRYDSLELYIAKNGTPRRVLNHGFKVMKKPALVVTNTAARSQVVPNVLLLHWYTNGRQLFKNDKATILEMRNSPDQIRASTPTQQATISSYKMDVNCGGEVQRFTANNWTITKAMRDALNTVKPGCVIKLYEIRCTRGGSANDESIIGPYTITITE